MKVRLALLGLCLSLWGCGGQVSPGQATVPVVPEPVALVTSRLGGPLDYHEGGAVDGFPASETTLAGFLARLDEASMRRHAWSAWASLTALSPEGVPVMLTWYQNSEIFGEGVIDNPRLFRPYFLVGPPDSYGEGNPPISFNTYNRAYRDHVLQEGYSWRNTLTDLVGKADQVVDFPVEAVAVKTVWWPVRHDGLTAFPVWDDEPTRPIEWGTGIGKLVEQGYFGAVTPEQAADLKGHELHGNDWGVFRRVVAIDPTSLLAEGSTAEVDFFDPQGLDYSVTASRSARVVPLSSFYTVQLNDQELVDHLNAGLMGQMVRRFWGRPLTQEDALALVAVHITTRETHDWVWATYWWHDDPVSDQPETLVAPFDHFRMDVAQSADLPRAEDGDPRITFNPYLEAGFALGVQSNCLGCHQLASWTAHGPQSPFPVRRGTLPADDPTLQGNLKTHFLWSLVFRPRPRTQLPLTELQPPDGFLLEDQEP